MRRYVLGDVQSEYMFINWKGFMVYIFYMLSVVGNNTYSKNTKMGGGTHSARRYVLGSTQSEDMFINVMRFFGYI